MTNQEILETRDRIEDSIWKSLPGNARHTQHNMAVIDQAVRYILDKLDFDDVRDER